MKESFIVSQEHLRYKKQLEKNRLEAKAVGCVIEDDALYEMQRKKKVWQDFWEGVGIGLFWCIGFIAGGVWLGVKILTL